MMNYATSPSLHGRRTPSHVDLAPPVMAALRTVTYREKDLLNEIGGHKFNGNHSRATEYIHGMESFYSKLLLLPYATGVASVIVHDGTPQVRFADANAAVIEHVTPCN